MAGKVTVAKIIAEQARKAAEKIKKSKSQPTTQKGLKLSKNKDIRRRPGRRRH